MPTWFSQIITPDDQIEVLKARLEINVYLTHMRRLLASFIDRMEAIG